MSTSEVIIHPTSIVEKGAQLDAGVRIGPFCIVGPNVILGAGTHLQSHVVIEGHTTMGAKNEIFPFASIGKAPQDLKYKGEPTTLVIGDGNRIRESATLQPGTVQGGGHTTVGSGNLLMAYTHVAHDCIVGNDNIIANGVQLSGHVTIGNGVTLGGLVGVHQFCRVGDMAMAAGGSMIVEDVPHYCIVQGDRATLRGLNIVGMRRKGLSREQIQMVKHCYKILFSSGAPTVDAAIALCDEQGLLKEAVVLALTEFVRASTRGVTRPMQDISLED